MALFLETLILLLITFGIGLVLAWLVWGKKQTNY